MSQMDIIYHLFYFLDTCVPYSEQACRDTGTRLGLQLGGEGYDFASEFSDKGCYSYKEGSYAGIVFYGTGGTEEQMKSSLVAPQYRPNGHDCAEGKFQVFYLLWTKNT